MYEWKLSPILRHSPNCRTLLQEDSKWKVLWEKRTVSLFLEVVVLLFFIWLFFLLIKLTKKPLTKIFYYLLRHRILSGTVSPWPPQASLCHSGSGFWARHRQMEHKGCHSLGFQWWAPENQQRAVKPLLHRTARSVHSQHPAQVTQGLQHIGAIPLLSQKSPAVPRVTLSCPGVSCDMPPHWAVPALELACGTKATAGYWDGSTCNLHFLMETASATRLH